VCRRAKFQPQMAATSYPLRVSPRPWHKVGLDYLTHLHVSNGFDSVLNVVGHLTRMANFLPCTYSVIVEETANLFLHGVYLSHGLPLVLVSDRDPKFISGFWQTLWRCLGTRLIMSSTRHPKTDGLTERVNNTLPQVMRFCCCFDGSKWTSLLPQVEFAYNANRALGIEHTPFEANFGFSHEEPLDLLFSMRPSIPVSQDASKRLKMLQEVRTLVRSVLQLHMDDMQARS
jgi:transposase InsO family protein